MSQVTDAQLSMAQKFAAAKLKKCRLTLDTAQKNLEGWVENEKVCHSQVIALSKLVAELERDYNALAKDQAYLNGEGDGDE